MNTLFRSDNLRPSIEQKYRSQARTDWFEDINILTFAFIL